MKRYIFILFMGLGLIQAIAQVKRPHQDSRALAIRDSLERLQAFQDAPYYIPVQSYAYPVWNPMADIRIDPVSHDSIISNYLEWNNYDGQIYSGYWEVRVKDFRAASHYRTHVNENSASKHLLNESYSYYLDLAQHDVKNLNIIYQLFDTLQMMHQLDRRDFAKLIVSCVQNIPYTLILPTKTTDTLLRSDFEKQYMLENKPVLYNMRHGILSPLEFVATLQGDCDTRCVVLYTILKHYKYDVAIIVSDKFNHAVLGILENYPGTYKVHLGKRYVIWETTLKDSAPGDFFEDFKNMDDWEVVVR